jgi:undecaprenyl-phosphate 4-deoxy-4-formamido-L-arabinose transferase
MKRKISIVIPCYNSEGTIELVVSDVIQVFSKLDEYDFELILVGMATVL